MPFRKFDFFAENICKFEKNVVTLHSQVFSQPNHLIIQYVKRLIILLAAEQSLGLALNF